MLRPRLGLGGHGPFAGRQQKCEPVFGAMGSKTWWLGEAGTGSSLKLVVNNRVLGLVCHGPPRPPSQQGLPGGGVKVRGVVDAFQQSTFCWRRATSPTGPRASPPTTPPIENRRWTTRSTGAWGRSGWGTTGCRQGRGPRTQRRRPPVRRRGTARGRPRTRAVAT